MQPLGRSLGQACCQALLHEVLKVFGIALAQLVDGRDTEEAYRGSALLGEKVGQRLALAALSPEHGQPRAIVEHNVVALAAGIIVFHNSP